MAFDDAAWVLNKLSALIGSGVKGVKQVASGTHEFISTERTNGATITTGVTVTPSKTVVLLNSSLSGTLALAPTGSSTHYDTVQSILTGKTTTTITVSANYIQYGASGANYVYGTVSWQLIEFY